MVKYYFLCMLSFFFIASPHEILSLIDKSRYTPCFHHSNILCDPFINMRTLPLSLPNPSPLYFAASALPFHSFGCRRPIILRGGEDLQYTNACVVIFSFDFAEQYDIP